MKSRIYSILNVFSNNAVIANVLVVGGITLVIKGVGFYKETIVAANFGLSVYLDTFFIAYLIPGFIQSVFLESFKSVFIPNYVAEVNGGDDFGGFQTTGFLITGLVSLLFAAIAIGFTDTYLVQFFPGHDYEYYSLIKSQFYVVLPCLFFWGFSSLLSGLLNVNSEFKLSTLAGLFFPVSIILTVVIFKDHFASLVLAIGSLVGSILSFTYLLIVANVKGVLKLGKPNFYNRNIKIMIKQIPAKVSSSFLTGMNKVVDQFFAAQLVVGSISAINYGLKIPAFLMGILIIAFSNVLLPHFSRTLITNREKAFRYFFKMIKWLFVITTIFALCGILVSDFLVELFYERNKFTREDSILVSTIQKVLLIYSPFAVCGMIVVNFLTSMNRNSIMAYVSLGAVLVNIILDYILMQSYGVLGIAISTTVVIIIKNLILFSYVIKISYKNFKK